MYRLSTRRYSSSDTSFPISKKLFHAAPFRIRTEYITNLLSCLNSYRHCPSCSGGSGAAPRAANLSIDQTSGVVIGKTLRNTAGEYVFLLEAEAVMALGFISVTLCLLMFLYSFTQQLFCLHLPEVQNPIILGLDRNRNIEFQDIFPSQSSSSPLSFQNLMVDERSHSSFPSNVSISQYLPCS